jgi:hypothetical protein
MKPLFIVDIDGTVCDSADFVGKLSKRFNTHVDCWDDKQVRLFMEEVSKRDVLPGAEILCLLMQRGLCDVIFLTGRSEKIGRSLKLGRRLTTLWLHNKLHMPKDVRLFMRPPGDLRAPDVIKFDVFQKQINSTLPTLHRRPFLVFLDDDTKVLSRYASYGLTLKSPECWGALQHYWLKDDVSKIVE